MKRRYHKYKSVPAMGTANRQTTTRQFHTLMLVCLACLLILIILSSVLYVRVILNRNAMYETRIIELYSSQIESCAEQGTQFLQALIYDGVVSQYLVEQDPMRRYELGRQLRTFLSSMKAVQPQIYDVFLVQRDGDGTFLAMGENQATIIDRVSGSRLPVVAGFYPYTTASGTSVALYLGCDMYYTDGSALSPQPIGTIAVAMSLDQMDDYLVNLSKIPGIYYALLDEHMNLIHGTTQYLNAQVWEAVERFSQNHQGGNVSHLLQDAIVLPVLGEHGTLLAYTRPAIVLADVLRAILVVLVLTAGMYLLLNVAFGWVRRSLADPITRLTKTLARGNPESQLPLDGNRDVQTLISTLNQLFINERSLSDSLYMTNARLREAELTQTRLELQFLRSQINPHFIYNSLEIIRSIAMVRKMPEVADISKSLAAILRYSIKGPETVPLGEEMEIIRCYLSIQQMRFGDRFTFEINVDDGAENAMIPRMCLQPIVENAVTHGLENKLDGGKVSLRAYVDGAELVLMVEDNGAGMPQSHTDQLNARLKYYDTADGGAAQGVGLINVARRIQIARGNTYGMRIESAEGQGTKVALRLPLVEEAGSHAHTVSG